MAHTAALTETQVRNVDVQRHDPTITYADIVHEGEVRFVDELRHAQVHEEASV